MNTYDVILEKIELCKLEIHLWSGRKKLQPEDLRLGDGALLPPDALASLGTMRIVGPELLRDFETTKKRAEAACLRVGTRFLGGFAIPSDLVPALITELDDFKSSFEGLLDQFILSYDRSVQDWIALFPDFEDALRRHIQPAHVIRGRLSFDYHVIRLAPSRSEAEADVEAGSEAETSLDRAAGKLGYQLFKEVAVDASTLMEDSLLGKQSVTHRGLNTLRRIRNKMDALSFLDHRVAPILGIIDGVLNDVAPVKGPIDGTLFDRVFSCAILLSDPEKMVRHGDGLGVGLPSDPDLSVLIPNPSLGGVESETDPDLEASSKEQSETDGNAETVIPEPSETDEVMRQLDAILAAAASGPTLDPLEAPTVVVIQPTREPETEALDALQTDLLNGAWF